jgi:hypothetical protein
MLSDRNRQMINVFCRPNESARSIKESSDLSAGYLSSFMKI